MKKIIFSIVLIFSVSAFTNVFAQVPGAPAGVGTPAGGSDKNLIDDNIKLRSIELERAKRDLEKAEAEKFAPINNKITAKFPEIKEDFEGIQLLQAAIIKAYTTGKTIDYTVIEVSALEIYKKAKRLDLNLFADTKKEKKENKSAKKEEKAKEMKDLIIELDNTIGSFVSSKIFANLQVIEPSVVISTKTDLLKIQSLSQKLVEEAKKIK